jgi:broad specificity phosphatase PhoE
VAGGAAEARWPRGGTIIDDTLELWLIRHGETDWNRQRRIQGHADAPLNDLGVRQAQQLRGRLAGERFDAVYSSDMARAHDTARHALPERTATLDPRLREIFLGSFEGRFYHELSPDELVEVRSWVEGPFDRRVGGGESGNMMVERTRAWLDDLLPSGRVLAFSHGGTIGSLLHVLLGGGPAPADGAPAVRFRLRNTSICRLLLTPSSLTLLSVNDAAHLAGLDEEG